MDETIEWTGPEVARDGAERAFRLSRPASAVPAVLWRPSAAASGMSMHLNV